MVLLLVFMYIFVWTYVFTFLGCIYICKSGIAGTSSNYVPLSMRFPRQEYWSGWPFPSPGDLPSPGTEPVSLTSPALSRWVFTTSTTWEASNNQLELGNCCPLTEYEMCKAPQSQLLPSVSCTFLIYSFTRGVRSMPGQRGLFNQSPCFPSRSPAGCHSSQTL